MATLQHAILGAILASLVLGSALAILFALMNTKEAILRQLSQLRTTEGAIMTTEKELESTLLDIRALLGTVATRINSQTETIQALQAQAAAGTPVTQPQLDNLMLDAVAIRDAMQQLTGAPAQPPAAPAEQPQTPAGSTPPAESTSAGAGSGDAQAGQQAPPPAV